MDSEMVKKYLESDKKLKENKHPLKLKKDEEKKEERKDAKRIR